RRRRAEELIEGESAGLSGRRRWRDSRGRRLRRRQRSPRAHFTEHLVERNRILRRAARLPRSDDLLVQPGVRRRDGERALPRRPPPRLTRPPRPPRPPRAGRLGPGRPLRPTRQDPLEERRSRPAPPPPPSP